MNTRDEHASTRAEIMRAIERGKVKMRPRWHFIAHSAFGVAGALLVFLTLLYVASLAVFFMRDSGVLFAPSFGARGWFVLARGLPIPLIGLVVAFILLLVILVKRFGFVYRKPLAVSLAGVVAIVLAGGFAIAQTPLHRELLVSARRGFLPGLAFWYRGPFRTPPPRDVRHGKIVSVADAGFVIADEDNGTTTVILTPQTRLPRGADFSPGERVVVIGDEIASGTMQAYGVREIDEYDPMMR